MESQLRDAMLEHYRLMQDFEEAFFVRRQHRPPEQNMKLWH